MKFLKIFVLGMVCVCLAAGSVFAQRLTGKITGTVSDTDGNPLPGVTVEISSPSMMAGVQAQITSPNGDYRFINLPPGTYKLVFKLEGFQTLDRENVKISVGKTVTENIVLQQATIKESVIVTAPAPVVDATQSGISYIISKDELEKTPRGRNSYYDVINMAPGLTQTGETSYYYVAFGSNSESNSFRIDGAEISDPEMGIGWVDIASDVFEEIEILGVGAPAEFGQYTGAVVNIVTKSGGNSFHGALSYYGQFQGLTADNNIKNVLDPSVPPEEAYLYPDSAYSFHIKRNYYASFNLGGRIVKDRLWFFGTYEKKDVIQTNWNVYPGYSVNSPGEKVFFKLTALLGPRHKLWGSFYTESFSFPNIPYYWIAPSCMGAQAGSTKAWNFMYTWQLSNSAFIELKYAGWRVDDDYLPYSGDLETPTHWDYSGYISGGLVSPAWMWTMVKHQVHANLSYFAEDFLGGDHEFKMGVQYGRGDTYYSYAYLGERLYYDYYGAPWYMYQQDAFYIGGAIDSIGAFLDDSWKIGNRLTLNLGFRLDYSNGFVPEYPVLDYFTPTDEKTPAVKDLVVWKTFSPRIGLVFSLTSDLKTVLKANYGRYYDKLVTGPWEYPGPNATDWNVYKYDWDIGNYVFWYAIPQKAAYTLDPDLKNPYTDQFSIGLEREFLPDFAIGVSYIYKKHKDLMGMEDRGGIYEEVSMVSPDNGQTYTLFNQTNVGTKEVWLTNPPRFDLIYQGIMLTLSKRYSHNWLLNASLTYSKSEGMNKGSFAGASQMTVLSTFGSSPNDLINAYGRMPGDLPFILKIQAGYTFPWDILASANFVSHTARPALSFTGFRLNQGWTRILAAPSGDERFPTWTKLDFRLEKTFAIRGNVRFHVIFDVFNVFNSGTYADHATSNMWSPLYHDPMNPMFPRRLQIGLKLEF